MIKNILLLLVSTLLSVLFLVVLIVDNIIHKEPLQLLTVAILIINTPFTIATFLDLKVIFKKRRAKKLFRAGH